MNKKRTTKKRYVIVGTGGRAFMFADALLNTYKRNCKLSAICDLNSKRLEFHNNSYQEKWGVKPLKTYLAKDFDRMIEKEKPDFVIVTTMDRTHHDYIIRSMELGCDVITEKPLTIDTEKCQAIIDAAKKTGRNVRVTFNYRYSPSRSKVKELLMADTIGEVKSVHFEWLLDTKHGADYFRRWHRDKRNSGGLMVHKSTHHFDLVNWWLGSEPVNVFGLGSLGFYGRANGEQHGNYRPYYRATDSDAAKDDPFAQSLRDGENLEGLYLEAEQEDGYLRDQNVFGDGISIEDTMNLAVRYRNGAQMSYSLTAYSPWEGYRIAFNGTKGRLELDEMEKSYISAGNGHISDGCTFSTRLTVFPHWEKPYHVDFAVGEGGHGGGDLLLLADLFASKSTKDPLGRAAGFRDGATSILTGIAANQSFATGLPVKIADLVSFD
ncbi:Gfo/Idh/MocA family protein [Cerasicoccus arenae]|uniref:Dehydrogenase n=1 Tax=Cerasicoccus arenae TaxID=424488 RepID=A0A8J3DGI1_9BACT|nr:Gfo/Idh/MocA family oxidoreductase [Cerasicoccus arenae]MBK1856975.1 Gfo/Idh/MocA family oxidoreductase [Cerasicoccus arenae]GHB90166.1 dehydrogenase [Cerasicoccus arenae]